MTQVKVSRSKNPSVICNNFFNDQLANIHFTKYVDTFNPKILRTLMIKSEFLQKSAHHKRHTKHVIWLLCYIPSPSLSLRMTMHNGKIRIDQALTPSHLFTTMKTSGNVIQGLTLLTERVALPNIISCHLFVNFDTISRLFLLFKHLRSLVKTWGIRVQCK